MSEETRRIALLGNEERIQHVLAQHWIGYTRAKEILNKLEDLLTHPPSHRMPNLLIVGDTNNGKTVILKRFEKLNEPYIRPDIDGLHYPVLYIQAPHVPDERKFYNAVLDKLFAPYRINDHVDKKQQQVMTIIKKIRLKLLIIDEIHHVLAGNTAKQRSFMNMIKYLGNELQIPIACAGTRDAFNAIHSDPQLANRFEPAVLHRWKLDEDYFRLLLSLERVLPLRKPSNLMEDATAIKILSMSEGTIGEIVTLLKTAARHAIESGSEKITLPLLSKVNWISPSERNRLKMV